MDSSSLRFNMLWLPHFVTSASDYSISSGMDAR